MTNRQKDRRLIGRHKIAGLQWHNLYGKERRVVATLLTRHYTGHRRPPTSHTWSLPRRGSRRLRSALPDSRGTSDTIRPPARVAASDRARRRPERAPAVAQLLTRVHAHFLGTWARVASVVHHGSKATSPHRHTGSVRHGLEVRSLDEYS